ncbi:uncharacterized protein LOC122438929 [Cervus canadensis]|uniref:uncharacterized protein LOC122438929 n=1 Tax=Cervus canadensis TaxID=1574408 RepID=UPI001C9E7C28|nr:uncharacterized protein LOC122438929 [Cervus canadensis]
MCYRYWGCFRGPEFAVTLKKPRTVCNTRRQPGRARRAGASRSAPSPTSPEAEASAQLLWEGVLLGGGQGRAGEGAGEGQGAGFQETSLALRAGELRRPNGVKARGSCRARCKEASAARPWRAVGDSQDGAAGTPRAVGRPEGPGGGRGTRVIQPCQQHALSLPGFVRRSEDGDRGLGVRGRGEEAHGKESEIWGPSLKKKNRAREEAIASGRSEVSTREGILKPSLRAALRPPASQRGSDVLNENKVGSARLSPRRVTTRTFFQERRAGGYRRRRQLRKEVRGEGPDRGQGCCTSILSAPEKPSQKRNPCKQIQLPTDWKLLCHCFM